MSTHCHNCGALIASVRTGVGQRLVVDLEPSTDGRVVVDGYGYAHVLSAKGAMAVGGPRYVLHSETCTNPRR